jgi:hypothetical protein
MDDFDALFPPRKPRNKQPKPYYTPGAKINAVTGQSDAAYSKILAHSQCPKCSETLGQLTDERRRNIARVVILQVDAPLQRWSVKCRGDNWLHITGADGIDRLVVLAGAKPDKVRFLG